MLSSRPSSEETDAGEHQSSHCLIEDSNARSSGAFVLSHVKEESTFRKECARSVMDILPMCVWSAASQMKLAKLVAFTS